MKLKATESTAVQLFASYRRKGMAADKAMAIVGASLQITPQDLAELLSKLDLLDTAPNAIAATATATDMAEVDIAEGLNALANEGPRQLGDGHISFKDILEDFPDTEGNA
tara:strand:+ start:146 stop:475 length:330 start_codon:yes stop_codon:yes gene_type:complete